MFVALSFINREKSCTCRSPYLSTCVISALVICTSQKSRAFIQAYTWNTQSVYCAFWVLAQLVYALLAGHKQYLWPLASNQKQFFYRKYVWMTLHVHFTPTDWSHCFVEWINHLFYNYVLNISVKNA